jgi:hypothetical protein
MAVIRGNFFIQGTNQNDQIFGGNFADLISGGGGDDRIFGGGGNDILDGGTGRDMAEFSQEFFRSSVVRSTAIPDRLTVSGPDGIDQVSTIEVLNFGGLEIDVTGALRSTVVGGGLLNPSATMVLSGFGTLGPGTTNVVSRFSLLADGSAMNSEALRGNVLTGDLLGDDRGPALFLQTSTNDGRLRVNDLLDANQQIRLGDLDDLEFDYFLASSSRTDVIPAIRLLIDADGNLATTNDRGELVFEWAYQGFGATTVGSWLHADLAGDDWVAWQRSNGTNWDQIVNMTELSDWADANGFSVAGGLAFDEDSLIIGWSIAVGSGNGTISVLLDNLAVGPTTYNFEFP